MHTTCLICTKMFVWERERAHKFSLSWSVKMRSCFISWGDNCCKTWKSEGWKVTEKEDERRRQGLLAVTYKRGERREQASAYSGFSFSSQFILHGLNYPPKVIICTCTCTFQFNHTPAHCHMYSHYWCVHHMAYTITCRCTCTCTCSCRRSTHPIRSLSMPWNRNGWLVNRSDRYMMIYTIYTCTCTHIIMYIHGRLCVMWQLTCGDNLHGGLCVMWQHVW